MPASLPREPKGSGSVSLGQIKLAVGGLRFDRDIVANWQVRPSIGLVAKDVERLGVDIRSFKEPLTRAVKRVMIPSIRKNFDVGGRPPWEPLAEATIKLRGYSAWPILVRSGKLRKGATQLNIWDIGLTSATVRKLPDNIWYGAVHQAGTGSFGPYMEAAKKQLGRGATTRDITKRAFALMEQKRGAKGQRKVSIPQRRFILYQEDDIDDINDIFVEWLEERIRAVGRFG